MLIKAFRLLSIALLAAVALGTAVGSASATRLSISPTLASASGRLTLTGGLQIICDVTLGANFLSTFTKTAGGAIGTLLLSGRGSTVINCNLGATVTVLNGIVLNYLGFGGSLPNITNIQTRTTTPAFLINIPTVGACLFVGRVDATFNRNTGTGAATNVVLSNSALTTGTVLSGSCPSSATLAGTLTVMSPAPIIRLI